VRVSIVYIVVFVNFEKILLVKQPTYIQKLIEQGEHQQQDFKFEISDSRKIAKTFVAFANTDGGKLLIGVKDNGAIKGIKSMEEFYMAEAAATMYSKPEIEFGSREWNVEGKKILVITIPPGDSKPYYAEDDNGKWLAYVRVHDQNILANRVWINAWRRKQNPVGTIINYTENERLLLEYLEDNDFITVAKYKSISGLSRYKAENILTNFLSLDLIEIVFSEKSVVYRLAGECFE
jgi:predicted HTH transcriptional regulator